MSAIPIILLAAGQSSRMGGLDKLMQPIDGIPLLRRSAQTAQAVGQVIAALPPKPHARYAALDGLGVIEAEITNAAEGMNASLRRALAVVPADAPAVMILLADLPDLSSEDLNAVVRSMKEHPDKLIWRGATQDGVPGHPVIFHRALFDDLAQLTGDGGAQEVVMRHKDKVHLQPLPNRNALLDLDTPSDWANWRKSRRPK